MLDALNPGAALTGLQEFLETGGDVLLVIMAATFIMWAFILERLLYWQAGSGGHKAFIADRLQSWETWRDKVRASRSLPTDDPERRRVSYEARAVRNKLISEVRLSAERNVELIKTLVAIAPLLGLMGTVTGMVEVFDVMAISGSSNARAMSAGVSKATIPTMAGMVSALSGLLLSNIIERRAKVETQTFADELEI